MVFLTPEKIAESCSNANWVSPASNRATVVLPEPGGPHSIIDGMRPDRRMRVNVPSVFVYIAFHAVLRLGSRAGRPIRPVLGDAEDAA